MNRRQFTSLLGGTMVAALRLPKAFAQTPPKRPWVACVVGGSKTAADPFFGGFLQGMRELGYDEDRDYSLRVRYAEGDVNRITVLTEEVLRLKPDVLVSGTMAGVLAAKKITNSIPIVSEALTDPVGFGVAASHARPDGNVSGMLLMAEDLPTKLLSLALEIIPGTTKVGLLVNPSNPIQSVLRRGLETAARRRGIELVTSEATSGEDVHAALQKLSGDNAKIVLALHDMMFLNERKRIALFAMAERLPTVFGFRENVEDGGLMSYGTDMRENWRRTATFVDKILKGAKPSDLTIEYPTKVQLVINLTAAKALGLDIPPTLLARADDVIK